MGTHKNTESIACFQIFLGHGDIPNSELHVEWHFQQGPRTCRSDYGGFPVSSGRAEARQESQVFPVRHRLIGLFVRLNPCVLHTGHVVGSDLDATLRTANQMDPETACRHYWDSHIAETVHAEERAGTALSGTETGIVRIVSLCMENRGLIVSSSPREKKSLRREKISHILHGC